MSSPEAYGHINLCMTCKKCNQTFIITYLDEVISPKYCPMCGIEYIHDDICNVSFM